MLELDNERELTAKMIVVGVGGGGNNAVSRMISEGLAGVDFVSAYEERITCRKPCSGGFRNHKKLKAYG